MEEKGYRTLFNLLPIPFKKKLLKTISPEAYDALFLEDESMYDDMTAGEIIGILGLGPRARRARLARKAQRREAQLERQALKQLGRKLNLMDRLGLADRLGLPGATDVPTGGPPALVETPQGPAFAKSGSVAQGKLFPLGQVTLNATAAGPVAGTLEVRAERSFRPTRLMLFTDAAPGSLVVSDISVGTARQIANLEVMPVEAFSDSATAAWIDFDIIEPGVLASVDVIWAASGAGSVNVSGVYYGTEL